MILSLGTGLLFGLVPAWHASRDAFTPALTQGGRGQPGDRGGRARRLLIVVELALALMLLVGGGLLVRTFLALQHADPAGRMIWEFGNLEIWECGNVEM